MDVNIDISQITILENFFRDLSASDQKKVFTSAYRKASKPLIDAAKNNVPQKTGRLYRSIGSIANPKDISILIGAKLAGSSNSKTHFHDHGIQLAL